MNKNYYRIFMLFFSVFLLSLGAFLGLSFVSNNKVEEKEEIIDKVITYEEEVTEPVINKVSKDYEIKKIIKYSCGHEVTETFIEYDTDIDKIEEKYSNEYDITYEDNNIVIITKALDEIYGDHFCLKILNDNVVIYNIENEGKESLYKNTEIHSDTLRDEMRELLEEGIRLDSLEELNEMIEDLES